jgi:hypothetical protein
MLKLSYQSNTRVRLDQCYKQLHPSDSGSHLQRQQHNLLCHQMLLRNQPNGSPVPLQLHQGNQKHAVLCVASILFQAKSPQPQTHNDQTI